MPAIVSICTGTGGMDDAVKELIPGSYVEFFAEVDEKLSQWYSEYREPDAFPLYDMKTVNWGPVREYLEGRDVIITGGYPCQPFSQAGKRLGEQDPRHLWPEVLRAIRELRPQLVVLENVRGHVRKGLDAVLGDLADVGFDCEWSCYRASDVGAPHRRDRVFIVAYPNHKGSQGA